MHEYGPFLARVERLDVPWRFDEPNPDNNAFESIKYLASLRLQYHKDGDSKALFDAIEHCLKTSAPVPEWTMTAFSDALRRAHAAESNSWDAFFGRPWPDRTKIENKRRQVEIRDDLVERVLYLNQCKGRPQLEVLEEVGKEFGIKKTLCGDLYREGLRYHWVPPMPSFGILQDEEDELIIWYQSFVSEFVEWVTMVTPTNEEIDEFVAERHGRIERKLGKVATIPDWEHLP